MHNEAEGRTERKKQASATEEGERLVRERKKQITAESNQNQICRPNRTKDHRGIKVATLQTIVGDGHERQRQYGNPHHKTANIPPEHLFGRSGSRNKEPVGRRQAQLNMVLKYHRLLVYDRQ